MARPIPIVNLLGETIRVWLAETQETEMASTLPATLAPALDRLRQIANLSADWDSYGAIPPSQAAIRIARQVLEEVVVRFLSVGRQAEPKMIGARADGGVLMEWRGPGGALEVHGEPDGTLGFLWNGDGTMQSGYEEAVRVSTTVIDQQLARILAAKTAM